MSENKFEKMASEVGRLVDKKNKAYGNSYGKTGEFLRLLYPNGISPEQYTDLLCVVRIFDKLKRIASERDAFDEEPMKDLLGIIIRWIENIQGDEPSQ